MNKFKCIIINEYTFVLSLSHRRLYFLCQYNIVDKWVGLWVWCLVYSPPPSDQSPIVSASLIMFR